MRRNKFVSLICAIAILLLVCSVLSACEKDEIRNLAAKHEAVQIPVNGSIYIGNYITYDGKGKLSYSVENADVLQLKRDKVTGLKPGKGKVVVSTKSETVSFIVYVVNPNEVSVEAVDIEEVYDGTVKNISVIAPNLPEGSEIKYYLGGAEFFGTAEPGEYEITVSVNVPDGFSVAYIKEKAVLTIDKATVSMSGVRFESAAYDYDGTEKTLLISGQLPDSVSVRYENNKGTDAGEYRATAYFDADTRYYYEIMPLSAKLTIRKAALNYSRLGFSDKTATYNGNFQHIAFESLPEGLYVTYYLGEVSEANRIADITVAFKDSGTYQIVAVMDADEIYRKNYVFDSQVRATLEIRKADFVNNLQWKDVPTAYIYDGEGITAGEGGDICLAGDLPAGVNGEFSEGATYSYFYKVNGAYVPITSENSTKIAVGTYTVAARFTMPEGYEANYNALPDMEFSYAINKASYDMSGVSFTGETFAFDGGSRVYAVTRPEGFDDDVLIKYSMNENGVGFTAETETPYSVRDAGTYQIRATFVYQKSELVANYLAIPAITINVKVNPLAVELGDVTFFNRVFTYQAETARSLEISGTLPDGVEVGYSANNAQINAGVYSVTAQFSYRLNGNIVDTRNYYFTRNSSRIDYAMTATLTINKASYTESDVPVCHVIGGIYSPTKKLSDYVILGEDDNPAQHVTWANPNVVPTVGNPGYTAFYNADSANYNNYGFSVSVPIDKATVDGSLIDISSQFIKRTGAQVSPSYTIGGQADSGVLRAVVQSATPLIEWGEYPVTVTFELADSVNYQLINTPTPKAITVYIYNGSVFSYEGTRLSEYHGSDTVLTVIRGTTGIKRNAIKDNTYLSEIILPDTLVKSDISNMAISIGTLPNLSRITLPFTGAGISDAFGSIFGLDNSQLPTHLQYVTVTGDTTVPAEAFKNARYLKSIAYSNDVMIVGDSAFDGCSALSALTIGNTMEYLGQYAFRYCFNITRITLPFIGSDINDTASTITRLIGQNAGDNAYSNYFLSQLTISGNITTLPDYAFAGLSRLGTLTLPETVTSIGREAFSGVAATVNLNENITAITERMFYNYQGTAIMLPSSVTSIGAYAFAGAAKLVALNLPSAVESVGEYAFKGVKCPVVFTGNNITSIGQNAFREYAGSGFKIPSSVTSIGDYAFRNSSITNIIIPAGVGTLGKEIFAESVLLEAVHFYNTTVGEKMFYGCAKLVTVNTENTERIEKNAFENCTSLTSVLLKGNVTYVGEYAFYGCREMDWCEIRAREVITLGRNCFIAGLTIRVFDSSAYLNTYPEAEYGYNFLIWGS